MTEEEETTQEEVKEEEKTEEKKEFHKPTPEELQLREDVIEFYQEHFDLNALFQLIDKDNFSTREFGFIRMDQRGMSRNQSFENPEHLKEYLTLFPVQHAYVGAVYEDRVMPSIRYMPGTSIDQTKWLGRELTFDLDLTDYDPVRPCDCSGREFCEDCWVLMQEAADIMDDTLRVDFGFEEIVWLFSGGRGYHAWVLDDITFDLDEEQRKAIVGYFQLIYTTVNYEKIEEIGDHATFLKERVYQKLGRKYLLETPVSQLIEIEGIGRTTAERAKELLKGSALVKDIVSVVPKEKPFLEEVIKKHYPRLDGAVTEGHNHLIRMPGGVHMGTGYLTQIVPNPTQFLPMNDAVGMYQLLGRDPPEEYLN